MLSFIIGFIGVIIALVGWYAFDSLLLLIIGTILYFVESFLERNSLNTNAKILDIVIIVIGCIIGLFSKYSFYVYGMLAINFYSAIMCVLGIFYYLKN